MSTKKKVALIGIVLFVLLLAAAAYVGYTGFYRPYHDAENTMTLDRDVTMTLREDGSVLVQWPESQNGDRYLLEIVRPAASEEQEQVLFSQTVTGEPQCVLNDLFAQERVTLRISSQKGYFFLFGKEERLRQGTEALTLTDVFAAPAVSLIDWTADTVTDVVDVSLDVQAGVARLYTVLPDGQKRFEEELPGSETTLAFGPQEKWTVPGYDETRAFTFDALRRGDGYVFYGLPGGDFSLKHEDFLGTALVVTATEDAPYTTTLTWNETKGESYRVEYRDGNGEDWNTYTVLNKRDERSVSIYHRQCYSTRQYRVLALGAVDADGMPIKPTSETVTVETRETVVYSTIWPLNDLTVYDTPQKKTELGTAEAGTAFCVLALEDGMFKVRFGDGFGYLDSNYCLINLPEVIGSLCRYNITNSCRSIYKIHDFDIEDVTDEVTPGYEYVLQDDGTFLVPLLYPVLPRLQAAAETAARDGYTLLIYDSFRPQRATYELNRLTREYCEEEIPYSELEEYDDLAWVRKALEEKKAYDKAVAEAIEAGEDVSAIEEPKPVTYEQFMTNDGYYAINYFLAVGTSMHNLGLAMDLTLVRDGYELEMQTAMHDLSWYSEIYRNNSAAYVLEDIMEGAGFGGLVSEWWHFQDDEVHHALDVSALWSGVSARCWTYDGTGWRYRLARGSYLTDCEDTVDGVTYRFDANGYVLQEVLQS